MDMRGLGVRLESVIPVIYTILTQHKTFALAMQLRAVFSKNQTGSDSDVGKNRPKSYILFITVVKHPIQVFFSLHLCVFVLRRINILVPLTLFFHKLCRYSF